MSQGNPEPNIEAGRDAISGKIDAAQNAAVGSNIDQDARRNDGQQVVVHVPQYWHPPIPDEGIPLATEQRLDTEIRELRRQFVEMNATIAAFTYQLKSEAESRTERIASQERMINTIVSTLNTQVSAMSDRLLQVEIMAGNLAARSGKRDPLQMALGIVGIVLLTVIAWTQIGGGT